jgi:RNA polymerase sigma-70 factor, ECF subfamily
MRHHMATDPPSTGFDPSASAAAERRAVEAVMSGDEDAFLVMVAEWSPRLRASALRLTGDGKTADEVVRRAWRRALEALRAFRSPPGLRALLLRSLLDEARAAGLLTVSAGDYRAPTDQPILPEDRFLPPGDPQWPGHWATPPQDWPALDADPAAVEDTIAGAVAGLPESQRVVLVLRDCGGCRTDDVARILAVPVAQTRHLLHHARGALRASLEQRLVAAAD